MPRTGNGVASEKTGCSTEKVLQAQDYEIPASDDETFFCSARSFGGIFLCPLMFVSTGFAQDAAAENKPSVEPWQRQVFFGQQAPPAR